MAGRKSEYLAKAKDAEQEAQRTRDPEAKRAWLRVAENYRQLADLAKD
jgi:hypothetical protein